MKYTSIYNTKQCLLQVPGVHILLSRLFSQQKLTDLLLNMSRDTTHTVKLSKQRAKMKEKNMKYASGIINLQVLGSGANGAPTSLYLFTDQSRYLFISLNSWRDSKLFI